MIDSIITFKKWKTVYKELEDNQKFVKLQKDIKNLPGKSSEPRIPEMPDVPTRVMKAKVGGAGINKLSDIGGGESKK